MRKLICLSLLLGLALIGLAQNQQGYVKTKGRMVSGKYYAGKPINGATVQVKGGGVFISRSDGTFLFPVSGKSYNLQKVQKQGYVLLDQDLLYRQFAYSSNPLEIVMEDKAQLEADRRALERQVRRVTDEELRRRGEEIEALKEQNKITEERYRELLNKLNNDYDQNEQLIKNVVEQYNKIDFDQWDEFNSRVSDCITNGRLEEADSLFRSKGDIDKLIGELNKLHESNVKDRDTLEKKEAYEQRSRKNLAQLCYNKHLFFMMKHQFDSAALYIEKRTIQLDPTNIEWLLECGIFFEFLAEYDKALQYYNKALSIEENTLDEKNSMLVITHSNIGMVYLRQGNYDKAMEHCEKANTILKSIQGETQPHVVATLYNNIGSIFQKQGNYNKAIEYFDKALTIWRSTLDTYDPVLATPYNNIGSIYEDQGDYNKALEYYNLSLSIRENAFGQDHPDVAQSYNNIGLVLCKQGNYAKSIECHNKALTIRKKIQGDLHPDVAVSYNNIGLVHYEQGNYTKATECYSKALAILKNTFDETHPLTGSLFHNLGCAYSAHGELTKALENFEKAKIIWSKSLDENHPNMAILYTNIGFVNYRQNDFKKALEYYNKALSIWKRSLDEIHPDIARLYSLIGSVYYDQGDYNKTLEYYEKALSILNRTLGETHENTKIVQQNVDTLKDLVKKK